ncbi:protein pigeon-like [Babylonia areolata]|uniref:protein pigeon-like n=1 Tax=Babylonia areolata TaxID=304850 RepID=UPI003FD2A386
MLEFVKTFDLLGSITQFLQERRQSLGITDDVALRPRLVNQEKGGLLIYTWNDQSEDAKVKGPVTHVGVYDPSTQKHKVLWIYNQKVRIVSCSLNRERTLLGFTIVTRQEAGQDGKSKDIYQAFLAELQSLDTRVFSLNLQRHAFLKVQFLYPEGTASGSASRHSHMVVMLHKESVGLYQIPMARIGDRGIMMSGQPTTEQVVRRFVWCQWDANHQRLYYIHNVRPTNGHADSIGHKLSAIQFHSAGKFDNMIDIPINFPFPFIKTSTRVVYADIPLHPGIPDAALNAVVLSQPSGSMCLCYQEHVSSSVRPRHATPPLPTQPEDEPEVTSVDINYYVCMVHHAQTLHGCAAGLPRSVVAGKRVIFQWFGDYLVAAMPGVFCHLLNVHLDFEPCHHILLHNHDIPTATKPPVPSRGNKSHTVPRVTTTTISGSTKSSATTSTDSSDLTLNGQVVAVDLKPPSRVQEEEEPQDLAESTSEGAESATRASNSDPSMASSSHRSQGLNPTPVPFQGAGPASPFLLRGLSVSPRVSGGFGDLPDTLSLLDSQCFQLSMPLVPCFGFFREAGSVGPNLYDSSSGHVWRLASNPDRLLRSFRSAYWSTQLAMLHYLIMLRTRDLFTIRQVFEVLTADPTAPEITSFLSEYLVASTFANMRKKSDKETTELLTFTSADTFRGQFEKNSHGERLARVTYTALDSVNISTKGSQERRRRPVEDSWDLLRRSLRLKQMPPPSRFSHEHVVKALQKDIDSNGSHKKKWTWVNQELEASFFDGMHTVKLTEVPAFRTAAGSSSAEAAGGSSGRQSQTETVLGRTPLFLQAGHTSKVEPRKKVAAVTEQLLVSHLIRHMKKDSRIKAQNIAREYVACQIQQCQQLCHLLWSIHMDEDSTAYEQLLPNLKEAGTDKEYQLFQIYERVFLVTQELAFCRPPGFSSFFTSLGFKCLSSSVFLQYVDRGILQLTPDFILQLLQDLPDDAENNNAEIKFHILSRLPKPFAEDCFQRWKHPLLLKAAAQQQVAQVLQEGMVMTYRRHAGSGDIDDRSVDVRSRSVTASTDSRSVASTETVSFKPLTIFIKHLEDTALEIQRQRPGSMSLMYDTSVIEEAAMSFTRHHAQFDLSTMNF